MNTPRLNHLKGIDFQMAATILPQATSIDTDGIRALLLSKLAALLPENAPGDSDGYIESAAAQIFIDQLEKLGREQDTSFAYGALFATEATLAVIADPFGEASTVLAEAIDWTRKNLQSLLDNRQPPKKAS